MPDEEPILCDDCGRDMAEAEMIDMSFRGPDGNIHNDGSWICPECFAALMEGP